MSHPWPWILLGLLGAYHGVNPAMGWLFAVALGMQERSRRAVVRSLLPIAIGHECSILLVAAIALLCFGVFRFVKPHAHFRWTSMRVTDRELTLWSFLMSTAHGAGLMVAPVLIGAGAAGAAEASDHELHHVQMAAMSPLAGALALLLHVAMMVAVMGVVAVVVYEKLGVAVVRQAWLNTEWLWASAFVMAGLLTLFT